MSATDRDSIAHTPGPWTADGEEGWFTIWGPAQEEIAEVGSPFNHAQRNNPNARLIAAAPDLLAACRHALDTFESNHGLNWSELESAVAKATGASGS